MLITLPGSSSSSCLAITCSVPWSSRIVCGELASWSGLDVPFWSSSVTLMGIKFPSVMSLWIIPFTHCVVVVMGNERVIAVVNLLHSKNLRFTLPLIILPLLSLPLVRAIALLGLRAPNLSTLMKVQSCTYLILLPSRILKTY